jgi:hypothetical protein
MTSTPFPAPLKVAEADEIAALLADLMPDADRGAPPGAGPPVGNLPLGQVLAQANWRNEPPAVPSDGQPFEGPFPAPVGVLALGDFLSLVNWRNRPDEAQPLPLLGEEPPPPGHEWTVAAVLSQFAWD